ncbi:hypothetical protein KC19_VG155900 [Ceratodon purpureus]|uniref:Uncharacterized protein n=1 Tax=Ceratodon purpureus TaxID=3225 RepID=A0A8T0HQR1_CERPU|nr:hypothetical protein KC19_VG155900 [Ceratodon purpureus]
MCPSIPSPMASGCGSKSHPQIHLQPHRYPPPLNILVIVNDHCNNFGPWLPLAQHLTNCSINDVSQHWISFTLNAESGCFSKTHPRKSSEPTPAYLHITSMLPHPQLPNCNRPPTSLCSTMPRSQPPCRLLCCGVALVPAPHPPWPNF